MRFAVYLCEFSSIRPSSVERAVRLFLGGLRKSSPAVQALA